ncbi:hypothetical protein FRC02_008358 [Tulasnella sp. 418]|nr:hypothetical protein FRC02_008358 [Tulasnella sp. 418]
MPFKLFDRFTSAVDVSDERYIHYQRKRLIPFTSTPFKSEPTFPSRQASKEYAPSISSRPPSLRSGRQNTGDSVSTTAYGPDRWDDEPVGERPPGWLELSGDLAWTATFSSLTSNTEITGGKSIVSYAVFFGMVWQLWASQATYDIKFYTNDWWHRLFFILQLCVYGGLAAFTSDFDIFWGLSEGEDIFVGDAGRLTAQAIAENTIRKKQLSFMGIALVIAISRSLLLIQYLRVAFYRSKHQISSWLHMLTPISIAISAVLFFACFSILKTVDQTRASSVVQLVLWGSAMLIELIGHAFTPDDSKDQLRGHGSITERLSTLTVIVMGEGLNGLCNTLKLSVNALGFGTKTIYQIGAIAIILYFFWLLYFDGFRKRLPPRKTKKEIWLLLHLPFHLFLILMLEASSNPLRDKIYQ